MHELHARFEHERGRFHDEEKLRHEEEEGVKVERE